MAKKNANKPATKKEVISITDFSKEASNVTVHNHMLAAVHHGEAAKYHLEAAKHYEAGNHEKGAYFALLAHGHHAIAGQFISDDAKHHAQELKETTYPRRS